MLRGLISRLPPLTLTRRVNDQLAWALWGLLLLIVFGLILAGNRRTVTVYYLTGAAQWTQGQPLYDGTGEGFIYLPQSAVAFVPFYRMPHLAREISWRMLAVGLFAGGVWRLSQLSRRDHGVRLFPLMTLICLPLAFSSIRNGQATLPMAGLMMLAVVDQCDRRWSRAALWLSLGLVMKPLMVVPILLAAALYPAMRWRLAAGLAATLAFPFACQRPEYVLSAYQDCWKMLGDAHQLGQSDYWAQLFGMLRVFGVETPHAAQTAVRLAAAVGTLGLCWLSLKKHSTAAAHVQQFALAAAYLMLMNPRTENNTYSLFAPALAVFCGQAWLVRRRWAEGGLLVAGAVTILCSYEVGKFFVPPHEAVFLAPLGCLPVTFVIIQEVWRDGLEKPENSRHKAQPEPHCPGRPAETRGGALAPGFLKT